ncbi:MAG: SDR family NAD(P)-dependent oxidoreductase [Glaciecola sp.]|jgi:NAD(P)-dependent dehydrogenase (short-subunit alcohol dehydrogenase family)
MPNSVYVITGGGSGLGFATAQYILTQGHRVALLDLNRAEGEKVIASLASPDVVFYPCDVTHAQMVTDVFASIKDTFGRIDVCINCAGIAPAQRVLDKSGQANELDLFAQVVNINLIGSYNVGRVAAQYMAQNNAADNEDNGVIINTASVAAYEGQIGQTAYAASKGGIVSLGLAMARDLAKQRIRVNTIAPGIMGTPMLLAMPEHVQTALAATVVHPPRLGEPEEFARLAEHIVHNRYLNGETIRLDGALRMGPK